MTYKETELQDLISALEGVTEKMCIDKNLIEQIKVLFKSIPVYPGIALFCLSDIIEDAELKDISVGDVISIETDDGKFQGEVVDISDKYVTLKNVIKTQKDVSIENVKIKKVKKVNKRVLEKKWKTLVFRNEDT